ncbi:hypothetical protein T484DRAFT_1860438 [Baffinella frigidus]|nr:hypothetical protein T484DRAFT_1860438 [Cryptophyta sp. CCMP2293]
MKIRMTKEFIYENIALATPAVQAGLALAAALAVAILVYGLWSMQRAFYHHTAQAKKPESSTKTGNPSEAEDAETDREFAEWIKKRFATKTGNPNETEDTETDRVFAEWVKKQKTRVMDGELNPDSKEMFFNLSPHYGGVQSTYVKKPLPPPPQSEKPLPPSPQPEKKLPPPQPEKKLPPPQPEKKLPPPQPEKKLPPSYVYTVSVTTHRPWSKLSHEEKKHQSVLFLKKLATAKTENPVQYAAMHKCT